MYRNAYQRGMLTIFFSCGSKPLGIWETHCQDGYITRFLDQDIKSMVLEIGGSNVTTTYISCPSGNRILGINMPFLVMIVKNLKKYFTFEVTILDETGTRRRFRVSNFQSTTQILPLCTVMPIGLSDGWNQIQFNLAEFTKRAYKKQFVEVQKVKINANIRLRRVYFTERLVPEDQLPPEYKLFFPLASKFAKKKVEAAAEKPPVLTPSKVDLKPGARVSTASIKKSPSQIQKVEQELKTEAPPVQEAPAADVPPAAEVAEGAPPATEGEGPEGATEAPAAAEAAAPSEEAPPGEEQPATEEAAAGEAQPPGEEAPPAEEAPAEAAPPAE